MSLAAGAGVRLKASRGHAGIVIFAALLLLATLGAGALFGAACAALRVTARVGAVVAALLFAGFMGYGLWETQQKQHVPPFGEVFGEAAALFAIAAVLFLPPYFIAHSWLTRRRRRDA